MLSDSEGALTLQNQYSRVTHRWSNT